MDSVRPFRVHPKSFQVSSDSYHRYQPKQVVWTQQPVVFGEASRKSTSESSWKRILLAPLLVASSLLNPVASQIASAQKIYKEKQASNSISNKNQVTHTHRVKKPTLFPKDIDVVTYPTAKPFQTYVFMTFTMPKGQSLQSIDPPDEEDRKIVRGASKRRGPNGKTEIPFDIVAFYAFTDPNDFGDHNKLVVGFANPVTPGSYLVIQGGTIPIVDSKTGESIVDQKTGERLYLPEQTIQLPTFPRATTDFPGATLYDNRPFSPADTTATTLKNFSKRAYDAAPAPSEALPYDTDLLVHTILEQAKPFSDPDHPDSSAETTDLLLKLYRVLQGESFNRKDLKEVAPGNPLIKYVTDSELTGITSDPQLAAALVVGSNLRSDLPPPTPNQQQAPKRRTSNAALTSLLDEIKTTFEKIEFAPFKAEEQQQFFKSMPGPKGKRILQVNDQYRNESPIVLFPLLLQGLILHERQSRAPVNMETNNTLEPKITKQRAKIAWAMATLAYVYQILSLQKTPEGQKLLQELLKTNTPEAPTALVQLFNTLGLLALPNSGGAPDLRPGFYDGALSKSFKDPIAFPDGVPDPEDPEGKPYHNFENFVERLPDVATLPEEPLVPYGENPPNALPTLLGKLLTNVFVSPEIAPLFYMTDRDALKFLTENLSLSNAQLIRVMKMLPIKGAQGFPNKR